MKHVVFKSNVTSRGKYIYLAYSVSWTVCIHIYMCVCWHTGLVVLELVLVLELSVG